MSGGTRHKHRRWKKTSEDSDLCTLVSLVHVYRLFNKEFHVGII